MRYWLSNNSGSDILIFVLENEGRDEIELRPSLFYSTRKSIVGEWKAPPKTEVFATTQYQWLVMN
jgi:hypothetical protein